MNVKDYQYRDWNSDKAVWDYKKKYKDSTPLINESAYLSEHDNINRRKKEMSFDQERPATFINRPLTRAQLRKKFMRSITKEDIEFKNLPLMVKFLNDTGKLYNRF